MRYLIAIISIFLISEIHNRCSTSDDALNYPKNAEECFNKAITSEDIGSNNPNEYSCCYIQYYENSNPFCFTIENSQKSNYLDYYKGVYAFGCSLDELPDQSESNSCSLAFPIKEEYCFTRTLSENEKKVYDFKPDKCCYLRSDELHLSSCNAVDESKKDEYIEIFKTNARKDGVTGNINIEITCSESFFKINIWMIFIVLKIILL